MSGIERRKILCSVTFHAIAIVCVVWSLFVLIQRTFQEVQSGELEWPFWTKLIVVAIGFTGSIVFMYVQCKMYVHLCRRWRAFNRVIYIQNAPEKIPLTTESVKANKGKNESIGLRHLPTNNFENGEKTFLGISVITHNSPQHSPTPVLTSTVSTTAPSRLGAGATGCCTTSSSPPGAIWMDEATPQNLNTFSYFSPGQPSSKRGSLETDTLIAASDNQTSLFGNFIKTPKKNNNHPLDSGGESKKNIQGEQELEVSKNILDNKSSLQAHLDTSDDIETLHLDRQ